MPLKILFGFHPDWGAPLRPRTERAGFEFHMGRLEDLDLSLYDLVVPLTLSDRAELARRAAEGEPVRAVWTSAEAEALCHDKLAFNQAMIRAGLGGCIPPILSSWPTEPEAYPLILKQRRDEWGLHSRVVLALPDSGAEIDHDIHFLQTYMPGSEEKATHLLLRDGEILFEATMCYTMPAEPHVKGKYRRPLDRQWTEPTEHLELFRRVLDVAGFRDGTCCIDYRVCQGQVYIFEVNPRFGGSLCAKAGDYLDAYRKAVSMPLQSPEHMAV